MRIEEVEEEIYTSYLEYLLQHGTERESLISRYRYGKKFFRFLVEGGVKVYEVTEEEIEEYSEGIKVRAIGGRWFSRYLKSEKFKEVMRRRMGGSYRKDPYIEEYVRYLGSVGRSERSVEDARYQVWKLYRYLGEGGIEDIREVNEKIVKEFVVSLSGGESRRGRAYKSESLNKVIYYVKDYLRYLTERGMYLKDPGERIKKFREVRVGIREVPSEEEIEELMGRGGVEKKRERALMELIYGSGLRISEALELKVGDIDREGGKVRVRRGKGRKERVVPMGEYAKEAIGEYMEGEREELIREGGRGGNQWKKGGERRVEKEYVFLNEWGLRVRRIRAEEWMKKWNERAKMGKEYGYHALRAACATHMVKRGCDIRVAAGMLGHKDLRSIERYVRLEVDDLREAVDRHLGGERREYRGFGGGGDE